MRLKALKSFVGQVTMTIDEVKEVADETASGNESGK